MRPLVETVSGYLSTVTINELQKGVQLKAGRFLGLLEPGKYRRGLNEEIRVVDLAPHVAQTEVSFLNSKGMPFVAEVILSYRVHDVKTFGCTYTNLGEANFNHILKPVVADVLQTATLEDRVRSKDLYAQVKEKVSQNNYELLDFGVIISPPPELSHGAVEELKAQQDATRRLIYARARAEEQVIMGKAQVVNFKDTLDVFANFAARLKDSYGPREARNIIASMLDQDRSEPASYNSTSSAFYFGRFFPSKVVSLEELDKVLSEKYYGTD